MSVNDAHKSDDLVAALRRENEALLRELENTYAQLAAVLQVSQDETRIAYSELQDKLVVQEKKLVELTFLGGALEALLQESDLYTLRRLVVDKISLLVPADLALLILMPDFDSGLQRERDAVREVPADRQRRDAFESIARRVEQGGPSVWLVPDLDADPAAAPLRLRPDARSAVCLALRARGQLVGLLLLNARLRANFRDDQEPLLGVYAHHAAGALATTMELHRYRELIAELACRYNMDVRELDAAARAAARRDDSRPLGLVAHVLEATDPLRARSQKGTAVRKEVA